MCKFIKAALKLNRTCRFYKNKVSDLNCQELILQGEFIHDQVMTLWMKNRISEQEALRRVSASKALITRACENIFKKKLKDNLNLN